MAKQPTKLMSARLQLTEANLFLNTARINYFDKYLMGIETKLREQLVDDRPAVLREIVKMLREKGYYSPKVGYSVVERSLLRRLWALAIDEQDRDLRWQDFIADLMGPSFGKPKRKRVSRTGAKTSNRKKR